LDVVNSPGTIDNGYRGEIKVILINHGKDPFKVNKFDRIAQILFKKGNNFFVLETEEVSTNTDRQDKGFGSSGISDSPKNP
jgi:dUTP pyrophosphatase